MQRVTLTIILLLLCAGLPGDCGVIEFPVLHSDITGCMKMTCARSINACVDTHGQAPTEQLKGCVVHKCRKITNRCVDQFFQQYLPLLLAQNPKVASIVEPNAELFMAEMTDAYLECWLRTTDSEVGGCYMGRLIDKAQPFITPLFALTFDDPEKRAEREMKDNMLRYMTCMSKPMTNWNWCKGLFDDLLASSPKRKRQYKDFLICSIHGGITATAKC
ncbi:uncharacterized protein LOC112221477 isoform X2 [Oncorhynchus tshawytscha]|uniref:uncharacterized protein LOC112221477 isoform X2 n=1 Tax=Oncorhynchus tshawytscha TaxID=74940 RepID=UPI000D0A7476|nr:uncharacterized protein LOC112221477 isoform X2 [Oncorhynchus tshawytscha]